MQEINDILKKSADFSKDLENNTNEMKMRLHAILFGQATDNLVQPLKDTTNLTPQPEKKRPKRLTALDENDETNITPNVSKVTSFTRSPRSSARISQKEAEDPTRNMIRKTADTVPKTASELMPPPIVPVSVNSDSNTEHSFSRPQRAAKLACEKNLKEPPLGTKLRRPSNKEMTSIKVKLEHEQRPSQIHESEITSRPVASIARTESQDSVVVLPTKELSTVSITSDVEPIATNSNIENCENSQQNESNLSTKNLRVRIKREKMSNSLEKLQNSSEIETNKQAKESGVSNMESTMVASVLSTTTTNSSNTTQNKKAGRKKKAVPKPIKVERISDANDDESEMSIATRTRKKGNSFEKDNEQLKSKELTKNHRDASVYQEALENLQVSKDVNETTKVSTPSSAAINETVTITKDVVTPSNATDSTMTLGTAPNDATYCTASAATFVLETQHSKPVQIGGSDLTFNISNEKATDSRQSSLQSMETARDTLQPNSNSLITEDESFDCPETPVPTSKKAEPQPPSAPKVPGKPNAGLLSSAMKACKMPTRTIEIFNPLVQSPVKKKVEAYENAAAAQAASTGTLKKTRSKQIKEAATHQNISPLIGKLTTPALGRFLTPTQSSNLITPNAVAQAKKMPASASKALPLPLSKSNSASNLKATASSSKALSRENSAEDFRKGLHKMAEERKKQREQKHLLAAQQREAKERERAERLAKVAKEREEKRLKKQQEAEQKRRELEDIQKKIKAHEEASAADMAKQKAKMLMEQEKALLQQMQHTSGAIPKARMPPPDSRIQNKYTFEMLHEDDSTDDESKTSYKRPPPPTWSRSHVRGPSILKQQVMPTDIIDSFFSVQPMTPDLKTIFPNIDPRHLKRNSSVLWSTPPRYSELPKY